MLSEAIMTRYHGSTQRKGARLSARVRGSTGTRMIYVPWNYELSTGLNHRMAAKQLILELLDAPPQDSDEIHLNGATLGDDYVWLIDPNSLGF